MEPKLKTFLSSAQFEDEFLVEREGLPSIFNKQPLVSAFVLWRIEDNASPDYIKTHYSKHVIDSDLVILLIGKNYREAVYEEFKSAVKNNIRIFAFIKSGEITDKKINSFIDEIRAKAVTATYSSFGDLVIKIENSIYEYYLRSAQQPQVALWREVHSLRGGVMSSEERALRLLAGVLASDAAGSTKKEVVERVVMQTALSQTNPVTPDDIINSVQSILRSETDSTKEEIKNGLLGLLDAGTIQTLPNGNIEIEPSLRESLLNRRSEIEQENENLFLALFENHKNAFPSIDYDLFKEVFLHTVTQVVYDTAVDMVQQQYGSSINPFPYNAEEINRLVANALLNTIAVDHGGIATWQAPIVSILQSDDENVANWLNRLRKAYWTLTLLGLDPSLIEYTGEHLKSYHIYLDSHIVIRAMAKAGGQSTLCEQITGISRQLGIEMRITHSLFEEVESACRSANKMYLAAGEDVIRALKMCADLERKTDILDGYVIAMTANPHLSWEKYLNRFYSVSNREMLSDYLKHELGIIVQPEQNYSQEQLGNIESITQKLLEKRRLATKPSKNFTQEQESEWYRHHSLRTTEARQMAVIYNLRQTNSSNNEQFWFVTFDRFVYQASASLVAESSGHYEFPCFIKPTTWLEIIIGASPEPLSINTFRETLLSAEIQQIADQLEVEVISQMLDARVDQDIRNIETLRHMFAGTVSQPAVQEAYKEVLAAEGFAKIAAIDKVKDNIISELQESVQLLGHEVEIKSQKIISQKQKISKAEGKTNYFKRQLGRVLSKKPWKNRKKR